MRRWPRKGRIAAGVVLVLACLIAVAMLWPGPGAPHALHCGVGDGADCVAASGRVVYVQSGAPGDGIHAVLLSRRSLTLPGLVVIKLPDLPAKPRGLTVGRWVSVVGTDLVGSHGRHDIHVVRLATHDVELRCRWDRFSATGCRVARADGRAAQTARYP